MVLAKEAVVLFEALAVCLGLSVFYTYGGGMKLPMEVVFPGHILYYLLTFSYSSAGANHIRKFVCVAGLVFGDMLLTALLLRQALPSSFSVMCLQFILTFTIIHLLERAEILSQLTHASYRGLLFTLEGVLKSTMLVTTIQDVLVAYKGPTSEAVVISVMLGSLRLLVAPCIYFLDHYFTVEAESHEADADVVFRYLRLAPVISISAVILLVKTLPVGVSEMQSVGYSLSHFILNCSFVFWFAFDATKYTERKKERRD